GDRAGQRWKCDRAGRHDEYPGNQVPPRLCQAEQERAEGRHQPGAHDQGAGRDAVAEHPTRDEVHEAAEPEQADDEADLRRAGAERGDVDRPEGLVDPQASLIEDHAEKDSRVVPPESETQPHHALLLAMSWNWDDIPR